MDSFSIIPIGLTMILLVMAFIITGFSAEFRSRASVVLFVFVMIATLPMNVYFCICILGVLSVFKGIYGVVVRILSMPLAFAAFLAVEEIFIGMIGRMIFRKQKKFFK